MKKLAWFLLPVAVGFVAWLCVAAEWESLAKPPPRASRAGALEALLPETPVRILFTGDVMLDRGIAQYAARSGPDSIVAERARNLLARADAVIVNLEGTVTTRTSVAEKNHADLRFTFDPAWTGWLAALGVKAASLSNNHTDDFGDTGLIETRDFLSQAGIAYFGSPDNADTLSTELMVKNRRLCFVGYEGFIHPATAPVAAEITRLRLHCDFLAATMHAGEEYQATSTPLQRAAARAFIDAGADIVIGTHPHVVEELEIYEGKPIFYSLGNFIFDQDFSWETEHGLAVEVTLDSAPTIALVPVTIAHGTVSVTDDAEAAERTLARLRDPSQSTTTTAAILGGHPFSLK